MTIRSFILDLNRGMRSELNVQQCDMYTVYSITVRRVYCLELFHEGTKTILPRFQSGHKI